MFAEGVVRCLPTLWMDLAVVLGTSAKKDDPHYLPFVAGNARYHHVRPPTQDINTLDARA